MVGVVRPSGPGAVVDFPGIALKKAVTNHPVPSGCFKAIETPSRTLTSNNRSKPRRPEGGRHRRAGKKPAERRAIPEPSKANASNDEAANAGTSNAGALDGRTLDGGGEPGLKPVRYPVVFPADKVDEDTLKIVHRLLRYGHEAYLVGGCVRDLLLDRTPKDFDVATSARPRQIKRLFRNCRIIGRRFKLAHIHFGDKIIEVSTFRKNPQDSAENGDGQHHDHNDIEDDLDHDNGDGDNGDGDDEDLLIRRDNVYGSAREDALRRDFTINAMFYDVDSRTVIDYVGGLADIERRRLDTIGVPEIRFREDPVRILRAVEFSARLDFAIDDEVAEAMELCGPDIERAARPRVLEEILQALSCGRSERVFRTLQEQNILDFVVPEIGDLQDFDRFLKDLRTVDEEDQGRRSFSDALLLTFMFRARIQEEDALYLAAEDGNPVNPIEPLEKIFGPFSDRMGVSRKNTQRFREIYVGLRKLNRRANRRPFNPDAFVKRAHFPETLAAFRVSCLAENLPLEEVDTWRRRWEKRRTASTPRRSSKRSRPRKSRSRK